MKKYFHLNSSAVYNSCAKKIVEAGHQLKTLRAMKAAKKKGEEAFYFIETEASVDKRAHWQKLDCAVIPDYEPKEPSIVQVSKNRKQNQIDSSSSESEDVFPPDDTGDMDVVAENAANAVKLLMNSSIVDSQLQSEYGNDNVPYVEDIGRVERLETGDEGSEKEDDLPNFDLIFQELGKLDSSNELLNVKARLMKLQESLVGGVLVNNNVVEGAVQEEEMYQEVPAVRDDGPNPHILDSVSVAKEGISHQGPVGEKVITGVVDNA